MIRYMGTKGYLVPEIHRCIDELPIRPPRLVDLFAGTGSVASSFADEIAVTCGDALQFVALLARSRFLTSSQTTTSEDVIKVVEMARGISSLRTKTLSGLIREEREALLNGPYETQLLIESADHVANSPGKRAAATSAFRAGGYRLTELYFARGYFSTQQAVQIDAYRAAIDRLHPGKPDQSGGVWRQSSVRDSLLAAWLIAASRIANSPGHAAQFLKSRNPSGHARVAENWRKDFDRTFVAVANGWSALGSPAWREKNQVLHSDANSLDSDVVSSWPSGSLIYADPPYTKDHYSRYYHLYETLYLYDYPSAEGAGRVRGDRHQSAFCYRSRVVSAFESLCSTALRADSSLLVSYPASGLLEESDLLALFARFGHVEVRAAVPRQHSTMGGSSGSAFKEADERLYLWTAE